MMPELAIERAQRQDRRQDRRQDSEQIAVHVQRIYVQRMCMYEQTMISVAKIVYGNGP